MMDVATTNDAAAFVLPISNTAVLVLILTVLSVAVVVTVIIIILLVLLGTSLLSKSIEEINNLLTGLFV